ncbi:DUF6000 family protein [Mariniblastus sp.]|nr:DUF6000 family protein [Mariniblastus sp.]
MNENLRKQIELHTAGATVRHAGPHAELKVPVQMEQPDADFINTWISPFYMTDPVAQQKQFQNAYRPIHKLVDDSLITRLLTLFNWRSRIVGAYFAAISCSDEHCDHIGRLLLRSDVCYAGSGYAVALARFNSDSAVKYLCTYLDYYLDQQDLWFDQGDVMGALAHLDNVNATSIFDSYLEKWQSFIENKPNWDLAASVKRFNKRIKSIQRIAQNAR